MCGPLYILYRCNDSILKYKTYYCEFSPVDPKTGKHVLCDVEYSATERCERGKICGRADCRLRERLDDGWRCCFYGHLNEEANTTMCKGPGVVKGRCWHLICPRCRTKEQTGPGVLNGGGYFYEGEGVLVSKSGVDSVVETVTEEGSETERDSGSRSD